MSCYNLNKKKTTNYLSTRKMTKKRISFETKM